MKKIIWLFYSILDFNFFQRFLRLFADTSLKAGDGRTIGFHVRHLAGQGAELYSRIVVVVALSNDRHKICTSQLG